MSHKETLLTPVGRLVMGSLYEPQTTDAEGKPLTIKSGAKAGQPQVRYFFALAIPKAGETHWSQTEWGVKIWNVGHASFPQGQAQNPTFAWKIVDGDSTIPNKKGVKPVDREGYPGHWVLSFSSAFAPSIYNANGTQQLLEQDAVNLGDYIQVYGNVQGNDSPNQPGVFLNHSMVALAGYGKRIIIGADPKTVGFGGQPLPAGASLTPISQGFNPHAPSTSVVPAYQAPVDPTAAAPVAAVSPPSPAPHYGILNPPNAAPARVMLPAANGGTYEQYIQAGWSDAQLIQHGLMVP